MSWPEKKRGHAVSRSNPAEPCPSCGQKVARSRLRAHFEHPECLVRETAEHFRAAGWWPLGRYFDLALHALGLVGPGGEARFVDREKLRSDPLRAGLLAWAPVRLVYAEAGWKVRRRDMTTAPPVAYGWWAPERVLLAVRVLDGVGGGALSSRVRAAAVRRAYLDPDWQEALRAARLLGGAPAVRDLARQEDPRLVRARGGLWRPAAQVSEEELEHG